MPVYFNKWYIYYDVRYWIPNLVPQRLPRKIRNILVARESVQVAIPIKVRFTPRLSDYFKLRYLIERY